MKVDVWLPITNLIATVILIVIKKVSDRNISDKLETVHHLVNNAASEQQKKVDALEQELRVVRAILDKQQTEG